MIRRLGAWLRQGLAVAHHQRAEDAVLVQAFTVAAVAQARREAWCTEHPDRPAVVVLRMADGTVVGQCATCAVVRSAVEVALGPVGVVAA